MGVTAAKRKISGGEFPKGNFIPERSVFGSQFAPIPPFIRLPKPKERCAWTQLSRTTLAEICVPTEANNFRPPVRARCIKTPAKTKGEKPARAKKRGIYLIPTKELFAYLARSKAA